MLWVLVEVCFCTAKKPPDALCANVFCRVFSALYCWQVRLSHGGLSPYELAAALGHILESHQQRDHHHHHHHHKQPPTASSNIGGAAGRSNTKPQGNNTAVTSTATHVTSSANLPPSYRGNAERPDPSTAIGIAISGPTNNARHTTSSSVAAEAQHAVSSATPYTTVTCGGGGVSHRLTLSLIHI